MTVTDELKKYSLVALVVVMVTAASSSRQAPASGKSGVEKSAGEVGDLPAAISRSAAIAAASCSTFSGLLADIFREGVDPACEPFTANFGDAVIDHAAR